MGIGLNISVEEFEDKRILRIEGRIDAVSAPTLEKQITALIEQNYTKILIDFSKVEYLSSAGMRLLLSAAKKLKARKGMLAFCSIGDEVMEIIKMAGFERILNIYITEQEALEALNAM